MRLNKVGLIFAALYAVWFVSLNGWSYFVAAKSGYWLNFLAGLPGEILFAVSMFVLRIPDSSIPIDSWMNSFYFFCLVSLVISYLFGWALSAVGRVLVRLDGGRLNRLDERLLDRFDRDTK